MDVVVNLWERQILRIIVAPPTTYKLCLAASFVKMSGVK